MSGEVIVARGTTKTLESNGGSISNNAIVAANAADYDTSADGGGFPDAEFVLSVTYSVAPTEGTVLAIYARPLDVDGTNDAEIPEAARPTVFIGTYAVNNVTTTQYSPRILARDVPPKATYYVHNNATGQTVSAGWTLKVTPRTYVPAP